MRTRIIEIAKSFLGEPYSKMDCSKYCQNVYKPVGLELPRTAAEQAKFLYGKGVVVEFPASAKLADITPNLKEGDLVWWRQIDTRKGTPYCGNSRCGGGVCKRWNGIHHVGIYAGNGKLYESITSQGGVVFRNLWESSSWQIIMAADVTSLLTVKNEAKPASFTLKRVLSYSGKGKAQCTGKDVEEVQKRLTEMGFYSGKIDGKYGPLSVAAVNALQTKYPECGTKGKPDGKVGPKTTAKLGGVWGG